MKSNKVEYKFEIQRPTANHTSMKYKTNIQSLSQWWASLLVKNLYAHGGAGSRTTHVANISTTTALVFKMRFQFHFVQCGQSIIVFCAREIFFLGLGWEAWRGWGVRVR